MTEVAMKISTSKKIEALEVALGKVARAQIQEPETLSEKGAGA